MPPPPASPGTPLTSRGRVREGAGALSGDARVSADVLPASVVRRPPGRTPPASGPVGAQPDVVTQVLVRHKRAGDVNIARAMAAQHRVEVERVAGFTLGR